MLTMAMMVAETPLRSISLSVQDVARTDSLDYTPSQSANWRSIDSVWSSYGTQHKQLTVVQPQLKDPIGVDPARKETSLTV